MKSRSNLALPFLSIFFCISVVSFCYALNIPEKPDRYVVDLAGIVDDTTEMRLNGYLQELEQKTTAQLVVLTIESLEGESIEDFSIHVAHDRWKLGQKGKDNGVLLVVSVKDRKYRIETGYGLEGVLPDSFVGSIGRNYLVPFFRKDNFSKGVYVATLALANEIAANSGVEITGMPKLTNRDQTVTSQKPTSFLKSIMFFIFLFLMLVLFIKNPRLFLLLFLFSALGGRRSSWGSGFGGGGFGGGGFGSFGGGGGGGFGGGGASGSW
jgi:uncharacterized protein